VLAAIVSSTRLLSLAGLSWRSTALTHGLGHEVRATQRETCLNAIWLVVGSSPGQPHRETLGLDTAGGRLRISSGTVTEIR
jgi:hypothetical protein